MTYALFFERLFQSASDVKLRGYWNVYGRASESNATPREIAAWVAINNEMFSRGLA